MAFWGILRGDEEKRETRSVAGTGTAGGGLPEMPAPGALPGRGGAEAAAGVSRRGVLGPAEPRLWRSGSAAARYRTGSGGARREPYRPDVHRRSLGRFPLRLPLSGRLRQSANFCRPQRRTETDRAFHYSGLPLCPSGQQAFAFRSGELPGISGRRVRLDPAGSGARVGRHRAAWLPGHAEGSGIDPELHFLPLRPWGELYAAGGSASFVRFLPPQPAEYLHRPADQADAARRPPPDPPPTRKSEVTAVPRPPCPWGQPFHLVSGLRRRISSR